MVMSVSRSNSGWKPGMKRSGRSPKNSPKMIPKRKVYAVIQLSTATTDRSTVGLSVNPKSMPPITARHGRPAEALPRSQSVMPRRNSP